MASGALTRIIDSSRIHAPGALDGVLRLELFNTVKEFFDFTDAWQERLPVFIEGYTPCYELLSTERGLVNRLIRLDSLGPVVVGQSNQPTFLNAGNFGAGFGGDFNNTSLVLANTPNTQVSQPSKPSPRHGSLTDPGPGRAFLHIDPPPDNELWRAVVAFTVADPTDEDGIPFMPEWAVGKYHEVIMHGILSRVMMHPAKPYSNPTLAMFHGRLYNQGMGQAKNQVRDGQNADGTSWRFPQTYRTRSQRVFR